jgi:hypothetical protein
MMGDGISVFRFKIVICDHTQLLVKVLGYYPLVHIVVLPFLNLLFWLIYYCMVFLKIQYYTLRGISVVA